LSTNQTDQQWAIDFANDDVNFDGYADLRLPTHICLSSRFCRNDYQYWLFDERRKVFKENKNLGEISGDLILDPLSKTFVAIELQPGGHSETRIEHHYRWQGNVPQEFKRIEIFHELGKNQDVRSTFELNNGTWKKVNEEKIPAH